MISERRAEVGAIAPHACATARGAAMTLSPARWEWKPSPTREPSPIEVRRTDWPRSTNPPRCPALPREADGNAAPIRFRVSRRRSASPTDRKSNGTCENGHPFLLVDQRNPWIRGLPRRPVPIAARRSLRERPLHSAPQSDGCGPDHFTRRCRYLPAGTRNTTSVVAAAPALTTIRRRTIWPSIEAIRS